MLRVIFTCLLVRAVHLETTPDYSTEGFLLAFRRFTAIRGFPNKVYSGGGSKLVGAANQLLNTVFNSFAAPTSLLPPSEYTLLGKPRIAVNLLKANKNPSVYLPQIQHYEHNVIMT